jgi:cytochrome P450
MTCLTDCADVDTVFKSRDFEQGGGGRRDSPPFVGDSLLALSGDAHFERRCIETALFRPVALRRYDIIAPAWRDAALSCTRDAGGQRRALCDHILPSGRRITAGEYVMLDLVRVGRDRTIYGTSADRFDPHRKPLVRTKPLGLGFGSSPHTCIGVIMTMGQSGAGDDEPNTGIFVFLLSKFYRCGGRMDPTAPPRCSDARARNEYAEFPVLFIRLPTPTP